MSRAPLSGLLAGVPDRLWPAVAAAPYRLLTLDYDGTLAPFHARRGEARPSPRALDRVARIASAPRAAAAVVSGRSLADLLALVGALPVTLIGEHGFDVRRPGGAPERFDLPPAAAAGLERAEARARGEWWGAHLERKRVSIVLHTRGLPGDVAGEAVRAGLECWGRVAEESGLRLGRIDRGLELRGRERDKGTAVRALLASCPPGTIPVHLGDDTTDEDAFREVREAGFGILVGSADRDSLAGGRLASIEAVEAFLDRWLEVVEDAPGAPDEARG